MQTPDMGEITRKTQHMIDAYREINEQKADVAFYASLSLADFALMGFIFMHGEVHPQDAAKALNLHRASITYGIRTLMDNHWITYTHDDADRRQVKLALNKRGASFYQRTIRDLILYEGKSRG